MLALVLLQSMVSLVVAKTVTFDWEIDWVTAAPDGIPRPVIGINQKWPCPIMEVNVGDQVVMNMTNKLQNETTGIHCHAQFQVGTPEMDGVPGVSMCPIQPGQCWTQTFTANPSGTHWYHSHAKGQYPDGIRSPLIVHDPTWEAGLGVEEQYILSVSDWYHTQAPYLIHQILKDGRMPPADASLMNDKQTDSFNVKPGKKYLFRLISMSAFMAHTISFEDHPMSVVAADGQQVQPYSTNAITLGAGQRYDVVITAKHSGQQNYAIYSRMQGSRLSNTGILKYTDKGKPVDLKQQPPSIQGTALDDLKLVPLDKQPLLGPVDQTITYNIRYEDDNGQKRIFMGNDTYLSQSVPSLYTALTTGENANNPVVYGAATNPSVIQSGQIIQIVVNNPDGFAHPMHLHGHRFQLVARGSGTWNGDDTYFPATPLKRDTATTLPGGHLVLRFKADNPGVWPFHCHMEWHIEAGMRSTFIESPNQLQRSIKIPTQQLEICKAQGLPISGNCAGSETNVLDTSKCNNVPSNEDSWGSLIDPPAAKMKRQPCYHSDDPPAAKAKRQPCHQSDDSPTGKAKRQPCHHSDDRPAGNAKREPCHQSDDPPAAKVKRQPCHQSDDSPAGKAKRQPCHH